MGEKEVAKWAERFKEAGSKRNEEICVMRGEGASLRDIARAAGLTHRAIQQILEKSKTK